VNIDGSSSRAVVENGNQGAQAIWHRGGCIENPSGRLKPATAQGIHVPDPVNFL